jgi:hypothetical protein
MDEHTDRLDDQTDEEILTSTASDEELEAAAQGEFLTIPTVLDTRCA